jgi:hypothetical protein
MVGRSAISLNQVPAGHGHHRPIHFDPNVEGVIVVREAF